MNIEKIFSISKIIKSDPNNTSQPNSDIRDQDTLEISNEALKKLEEERIVQYIKENIPDVRADKVKEAKEKIADENYMKNISFDKLADLIINDSNSRK